LPSQPGLFFKVFHPKNLLIAMRKKLFKWHSYCGLFSLVPLIIVSITGSILVFKAEIDQWLMPEKAALSYQQVPNRVPLDAIINQVEYRFPNYVLGSWEMFNDGKEADRIYLIKKGTNHWYKVYLDPFANQILSDPVSIHSDFTDWLLLLHYTFLLNDLGGKESQIGTLIGVFIALFLTFLGISGLIIHRKFWKNLFTLRWYKNTRIWMGDVHRLVGAWCSPVMLTLGITGLYFNVAEYYHEVFEHANETPALVSEKQYSSAISFQKLMMDSKTQLNNFTPTYILFPYEPDLHITYYGFQPDGNPFASQYASTVTYNKQTGELIAAYSGPEAATLMQVLDSFRTLHFGNFGGIISKLIWSILGFSPAVLGITGLFIWFTRRHKR
jgi:uncharacterized iron-regulated membrane protein